MVNPLTLCRAAIALAAMQERKLAAWLEAGVIDAAAAARIRDFEASHTRPLALWAAVGIAALAIGLGIISVIAANWDAIVPAVRLSIHFALLLLTAAGLWWKGEDLAARQPWLHEGVLFVFGMLGMAFFGHVGQVYQTSAPLWQPLGFWLVLFAPLLLSRGLSWLTAAMLVVVLALAGWNFAQGAFSGSWWRYAAPEPVAIGLATGAPVLLTGLGAWMRARSMRPNFWRRLEQLAFTYAMGGASLLAIFSGFERFGRDHGDSIAVATVVAYAALGLTAAGLVFAARKTASGVATAALLAAAAGTALLAWPLSGSQIAGALLCMALWAGVAAASLHAGWRGVFQFAVAAVALRLIVLSFELEDDLLSSGAGLIASGVLILGVTWLAIRVARRFAPPKEAQP